MSVLDINPIGELPIKQVTAKSMADLGFSRIPNKYGRRGDCSYERIKNGYKIILSLVNYSQAGTLNVVKTTRLHGKSLYKNVHIYRVETIDQFIDIVNTYSK